jgi:hypothetical protein
LSKQQLAAHRRDPSHVKHVTCHLALDDDMSHSEKSWHGDSSKKAGQSFTLCKTPTFDEKDFLLFSNMQPHIYSVMKYVYTENMFLWLIFSTGLMLIA